MSIDIPGGWIQATLTFTGPTASGNAALVLAFEVSGAGSYEDMANAIFEAWGDHVAPNQHEAFTLVSVRVVDNSFAYELNGSTPGVRTGDLAPPNVAALVKKTSDLRGRKYQGRNFWPGMLNDDDINDDGTIKQARYGTLGSTVGEFFIALGNANMGLVLLHNDPGTPPTVVTGGGLERRVATQRRRLRR